MGGLLRLCTAGSVDDGKSTLIGRLLHDSRSVYEDQIESVRAASKHRSAGPIDFSLFTDGLKAEREQGITIDVAYRYFATARRKFILADTPGHEQYTRNMATGASTADLAILLVDAQQGLRPQSRRHARIARLLGIEDFVVAVNKMDLVGFDRRRFDAVAAGFGELLEGARSQAIPVSALHGDNVITASRRTAWFTGPSLLEHLETVAVARDPAALPFRFPVQLVLRPDADFRGYAGQIASGEVRTGDRVTIWPSGRSAAVARIVTHDGDLGRAFAPMSVTLVLDGEIDVGRGDLVAIRQRLREMMERVEKQDRHIRPLGSDQVCEDHALRLETRRQARLARSRERRRNGRSGSGHLRLVVAIVPHVNISSSAV